MSDETALFLAEMMDRLITTIEVAADEIYRGIKEAPYGMTGGAGDRIRSRVEEKLSKGKKKHVRRP